MRFFSLAPLFAGEVTENLALRVYPFVTSLRATSSSCSRSR